MSNQNLKTRVHNILLVDDRPENLMLLEDMLATDESRIFIKADSGNEALKIAKKKDISLILLDVQMPEMDGFEVAEILQSNEKTRMIPIIFVTAISKEAKYEERGLNAGAIDYLFKPLNTTVTRAKVSNLLRLVETQEELAEKNKLLAQLNSDKNALLGMAADDLRNTIGVVMQLSHFILEDFDDKVPAEVSKCVTIINNSGSFMLDFVNNLMDVAKIEEGKLTLAEEDIDLVELIRMNLEINSEMATKKNIEIDFQPETDELLLTVDPDKIEQVLNNLLSNAVKYSVNGTKVIVSLKEEDGNVKLDVVDEGKGIPESEHDKLFRPFQKTSVSGTAGEMSTGLGLFIAKKMIEAHKGDITFESKVGQGTTFHVQFPVKFGAEEF